MWFRGSRVRVPFFTQQKVADKATFFIYEPCLSLMVAEKISLGLVMETIVLLVVGQARWFVWHAAEQEKNNEQA